MEIVSCSLKGILGMRKRGFYGSSLIKKRQYWPRRVHGDGINDFSDTWAVIVIGPF